MKKVTVLLVLVILSSNIIAQESVYVPGYLKKDGTYTEGYWKTAPNKKKNDNYSYDGNVNPYTGKTGKVKEYDSYTEPKQRKKKNQFM